NGLKIKSFGSVSLRSNESVRRGARVVCEAKEAVEVLPVNDGSWQSLVLESTLPRRKMRLLVQSPDQHSVPA
nr:thioredoxin [Tanacetum cinerariifolium]